MTSNIAELLYSMLQDEREYPVAVIFNSIAHRFGEIFRKRYEEVNNSKTTFVPIAETILRKNMTEGNKLYVNNINRSTDEFTMLGYGRSAKVNLLRQSCSCKKYDLVKLSCAHAMAVLLPRESKWSVAREYLEMQVLPPGFNPKLERRKVKRVKGVLEPLRYKKRNKFSKCKRPGNKRTTCNLNVG
ncbi:uncharacterized protein LOC124887860 [Capsicum annuum]|uniref:uncharacterized protein LOC124887860 n=1 Tax=Capsicum annuum TaxID=4072 RepID=UPI001FB0EBE7|nr:uncharacterized protein LOC124887860 [Capsicum annuum]